MKTYKDYLTESDRKYGFRVKIATEVNSKQMESLKRELARWNMEAISEPKRLPVAETHHGFGHLRNTELYIIDVVVGYPATPNEVQAAVHESTQVPMSHIMVLTPEQEVLAAPVAPETDGAILDSPYPDQKTPQLLADLANALKMKSIDMAFSVKPKAGKTSNDFPQSNTSPIGSKQNKIPDPYQGRKR